MQWPFLFPLELMFCLFHLSIPHEPETTHQSAQTQKQSTRQTSLGKAMLHAKEELQLEFTGMLADMSSGHILILLT